VQKTSNVCKDTASFKVVLIGTVHEYQLAGCKTSTTDLSEFADFLRRTCTKCGVVAVLEELSLDALRMAGSLESVPAAIARDLHLSHCYCDPGTSERKSLGIADDQQIEIAAWSQNWPARKKRRQIDEAHGARERYWLEHMRRLNLWPAIFICGADHVQSFKRLLVGDGIDATVARRDWRPSRR
jgi:hypothetical protein